MRQMRINNVAKTVEKNYEIKVKGAVNANDFCVCTGSICI